MHACTHVHVPSPHLDLALDLANLSVHADGGHHPNADTIRDSRACKQHVLLGLQLALRLQPLCPSALTLTRLRVQFLVCMCEW